jgi:hypothetical protein
MSFWLASPSMDPEIFFLSVSMLGWNLAFWRLGATFIMSLSGGYITHLLLKYGWLSGDVLRMKKPVSFKSYLLNIKTKIMTLYGSVLDKKGKLAFAVSPQLNIIPGCGCGNNAIEVCCSSSSDGNIIAEVESTCGCSGVIEESLGKRVMRESVTATLMVAKFMVLAYFLEAVLIFYVPSGIIIGLLGAKNPFSIISAALIGIPVYTSNLTALPMMGALIKQGMSQAAALAFLISGPLTTFPAMAAVWNLTKRKIFFLYVMYSVGTAIIMGYLFSILN